VGNRGDAIPLTQGRLTELQRVVPGSYSFVSMALSRSMHPVCSRPSGPTTVRAVLVRPDAYIAWAGDSTDRSAWTVALAQFGLGQLGV